MRSQVAIIGTLLAVLLASGSVSAAPLSCPESYTSNSYRYVTLTNVVGNVDCGFNGLKNDQQFFDKDFYQIDKADSGKSAGENNLILSLTGNGSTSGSISLDNSFYQDYTDVHLVFKFGNGQLDPDWISFLVNEFTYADWAVNGSQALSHATLWGKVTDIPVPEPGTAFLLATGIFGLVASRKRMKKTA